MLENHCHTTRSADDIIAAVLCLRLVVNVALGLFGAEYVVALALLASLRRCGRAHTPSVIFFVVAALAVPRTATKFSENHSDTTVCWDGRTGGLRALQVGALACARVGPRPPRARCCAAPGAPPPVAQPL
jgi:hypothetical protein